ncbi:Bud-site selection protein [Daldinia caldariorum]|uniref:Bud-site selection protein n=1 Tax=Daldinia caldariorum TaxID=326644 RepID=UPI0020078FAE|nr:Bud-site selection protein [Daldinia caldariorum]KAI1473024.1 Bud-site selection protein [Daldinia caldariorum]
MPKRKREPTLEEKLSQWHKELARGMKTAKGFERQRLSKRIREAQNDPDKTARLEREVAVLKSLDLQQAAHAHLCSSILKIKGVAESPKIPADIIKPVPKPEGLSEEEKAALHNVTSALCNRKQIRDVIEEAVMGTCIALRVPMPEKLKKGKGKKEKKDGRADKEEQADDIDTAKTKAAKSKKKKEEDEEDEEPGLVLLKRKREKVADDNEEDELGSDTDDVGAEDEQPFEGFSDSEAEEQAWSRYDDFVAGSSSDEDESDGNDELVADSRTRSLKRAPTDDISISSAGSSESEQEEDDEEDEEEDADSRISASASPPPTKRTKVAKAVAPISAGNSAFLPTLMGGYISGSESEASDLDLAPARKNRRGQRARQAIWEKKYKEKAKHVQKQQEKAKVGRDQGWDMRRGAVGDEEASNKPWKKGIRNPFDNKHVHPERQQHRLQSDGGRNSVPDKPKPKAVPKRDDTGPLHPSWAAAKKAKEEGQKVEFQGRKVVFD